MGSARLARWSDHGTVRDQSVYHPSSRNPWARNHRQRAFPGCDRARLFRDEESRSFVRAVISSAALGMTRRHQRVAIAFAIVGLSGLLTRAGPAQMGRMDMASHDSTRATGGVRAQAIALVTRVEPLVANRTYMEGYLAQPLVMAHGTVWRGHVSG